MPTVLLAARRDMARLVLLWLAAAWPLDGLADEVLRPREIVPSDANSGPPWHSEVGVTHLDPIQFPRKTRVAPTRRSPIDEPLRVVPSPVIGRQDTLELKTLGREELMTLILDGVEQFLLEIEPAWHQETADTGYWGVPATTRHAQIDWNELPAVVNLVGFLLIERDQPRYAGRYARADLLEHASDCIRYLDQRRARSISKGHVPHAIYEYICESLGQQRPVGRYVQASKVKHLDDAGIQAIVDQVRHAARKRTSFAMQNESGARQGQVPLYASNVADVSRTGQFVREQVGEQIYWSLPQDRAVRWSGLYGRPLAEIRNDLRPSFYPDGTTTEHNHFSFVYINGRFASYRSLLFTAAVAGRSIDELPLCYQALAHPDLAKGLTHYLRVLMRYNVSPDGCVVYPSGVGDMHRSFSFAPQSALDATVNQHPEAAVYLSRQVQHELWNLLRPWSHMQRMRHRPYLSRRNSLIHIYYMLKNWTYPHTLLTWSECQARYGGTSHLQYQDLTYHRNPHKQLQTKTSPGERAQALVCNFCPAPWKPGHGMEFLRQFVYASERDEVENFTRFQDWRITKEGTHSSLWGDYGPDVAGVVDVDLDRRKITRWDDGFTEIFQHPQEGIRRALFSLGGRVTVLMEESDRLEGKLLPMRFWVFNQDCLSMRAGHCPAVNWQIHLPERNVLFADLQYTADGQPAVLADAVRWYNVDERLAVVLPQPRPLLLGTMEWRHVRDSLYFAPSRGGAGVVYSGARVEEMPRLSQSVQYVEGLPEGWQGLTAAAPEGYRVYTIARFRGTASRHELTLRAPEGAPVFVQPTTIDACDLSRVTLELRDPLDTWSGEPRFFLSSKQGGTVVAQAHYHDLSLSAPDSDATVDVKFYCDTRDGQLQVVQSLGVARNIAAHVLRTKGLQVTIPRGETVTLRVRKAVDDDQMGPYVQITAPRFYLEPEGSDHRMATYWHPLPQGPYTFRATAADRSGVEKVEFYLNNGRRIGTDSEAPYECSHEIKDRFCQFVYAIAYDRAGNQRKSFEVPFGDGSIGPRQ